jgi:2-keto-4-pentenoate hydratase/2-oxohepta-3-ene-1,7-dioic acid hydratase in catechol pathway
VVLYEYELTCECVGVGAGLKPPKYLVPGTQMEVKITQIGTLKNGVDFE